MQVRLCSVRFVLSLALVNLMVSARFARGGPCPPDGTIRIVSSGIEVGDLATAMSLAEDGDTLEIGAGDYRGGGTLAVPKNLTLVGTSGAACTTIGGLSMFSPVSLRLEGLTVTGSTGVSVLLGSLDARSCVFRLNNDSGVLVSPSLLGASSFVSCRFEQNSGDRGGGVDVNGGLVVFDSCVFDSNTANSGGGLAVSDGTAIVRNSLFVNNTAFGEFFIGGGGAIHVLDADLELINCTVARNEGMSDPGLPLGPFGFPPDGAIVLNGLSRAPSLVIQNTVVSQNFPEDIAPVDDSTGSAIFVNVFETSSIVGGDPVWADPDGGDFTPAPGSPLIDAGQIGVGLDDQFDTDGDGDEVELLPRDLNGSARLVGRSIDIGAFESVPEPAPALRQLGALSFDDPAGWDPAVPLPTDRASFVTDGSSIVLERDVSLSGMSVLRGTNTIDPANFTLDLTQHAPGELVIGQDRTPIDLIPFIPGFSFVEFTRDPRREAVLDLLGPGLIASDVRINPRGTLGGPIRVTGSAEVAGTLALGSGEVADVGGTLSMGVMDDSGRLALDVTGSGVGRVESGLAVLEGALELKIDPSFAPEPGDPPIEILRADGGVLGSFDVTYVTPALAGGRFLIVDYASALGPGGSVSLAVGQLSLPVDYGDPSVFTTNGTPSAAALGDLNNDTFPDLAVTVPDSADPLNSPGQLVILLNDGTTGSLWDGFQNPIAQLILPTGNNPQGVAIGDLDDAGGLDIAVSNAGSDDVRIYTSDGQSIPSIGLAATLATGMGSEPTGIAIADLDGDPNERDDILVARTGSDGVRIYENQGGISFITCDIPTEPRPNSVDPFDDDDDGRADRFAIGHDDGFNPSVSVVVVQGGSFGQPVNVPIIDTPRDVRIGDLNGDGLPDVVTANPGGDSVTIVLALANGTFRAPVDLPVGDDPTSVALLDADEDGDTDVAVVATNDAAERVVQILRNDTQVVGQLVFADAEDLSVSGSPALVLAGDVDQDDRVDLVTVNDAGGSRLGPSGDVSVLLSEASNDCPGDLTTTGGANPGVPDGVTDLSDMLYFVNAWDTDLGSPTPNPGTIADVSTDGANEGDGGFGQPDGNVNLSDLLYYVNAWLAGRVACP